MRVYIFLPNLIYCEPKLVLPSNWSYIQKCTPNSGVLLEVERTPLVLLAEKVAVKNWERIHNGRTNYFMKMSFIGAQTDVLVWLTKIKMCIAQTGIDNLFVIVGKSSDKTLHHIYFKRVKTLSTRKLCPR